MSNRWHRIGTLGLVPPPAGSRRAARLRFVRDFQLRWLPIILIALLTTALAGLGWATRILAVGAGLLILDAVWLTVQVRRSDET